jgi:hypothetical protein
MSNREKLIIESIWPYGKPYPNSVILSRGIDDRIFQMPMSVLVKSIEALLSATKEDSALKELRGVWNAPHAGYYIEKRIKELEKKQ